MGEKYEYGLDFDAIAVIDIHTHVEIDSHGHRALRQRGSCGGSPDR